MKNKAMTERKTLGMYLHFPFCKQKCNYCDFYSGTDQTQVAPYLLALKKQLKDAAPECDSYTVDTVFFGGGTPTLMPVPALVALMETIAASYHLALNAEITIEANPKTVTTASLRTLRECGYNRISFGVQSADDKQLRALGRVHTFADAQSSVSAAMEAGFTDWNLDAMYGIPHQTKDSLLNTLQAFISLEPTHLSVYGLRVEQQTPFGRMKERLILPSDEEQADMYAELVNFLQCAGYMQYEISNFAKSGKVCRHNLKYWNCEPYLGFGASAYSDFAGCRFGYTRSIMDYMKAVQCSDAGFPRSAQKSDPYATITEEWEYPNSLARRTEYVMLRLRLCEGVVHEVYSARFGRDFLLDYGERLTKYRAGGFVCGNLKQTALTKKGMEISNYILSDILDF